MKSEVIDKVDFSIIRYSQCWEDTEVLLKALDIKDGDICLSIASAGDNSFGLLTQNPKKVVALDLNAVQLYLVELKKAAFLTLNYEEMLKFLGFTCSNERRAYYERCKVRISDEAKIYWDSNIENIEAGVIHTGKFDKFFALFRKKILPLTHRKKTVEKLLEVKTKEERYDFYNKKWNNTAWRMLFRIFFSKYTVGKLGRDPRFFDYAKNVKLSDIMMERTKYAFTELDVSKNPYAEYILTGEYKNNLPFSFRKENFEKIKNNLYKLELYNMSIEEYLGNTEEKTDKFNLSDIFEYMSLEMYDTLMEEIYKAASDKAILAYWNLIVPRSRTDIFADKVTELKEISEQLHKQDKAFFYTKFVVERINK